MRVNRLAFVALALAGCSGSARGRAPDAGADARVDAADAGADAGLPDAAVDGLPPFPTGPENVFQGLTVEFDFHEQDCGVDEQGRGRCNPSGRMAVGPGFEVSGDWLYGSFGTIFVRFDHGHYGELIRRHGPNLQLPPPDGAIHHYRITFDLRRYRLERDGEVLRDYWADSSTTEVLKDDSDVAVEPAWADRLTNVVATAFDVPRPDVEYAWEGAIGNTSDVRSGPGVWGAFHAMRKMTFFLRDGHEYGVAHFGYNEMRAEFALFDAESPNRVLLWFGRRHDITTPAAGLLPRDIAVVDGILLAKRDGGQVERYDTVTGEYLGADGVFPERGLPYEGCDERDDIVACPDFEQNTYRIGDLVVGTPGGYVDPVVTDPSNPDDPNAYPPDGSPPRLRFSHYIDDEGARVPVAFVAFQQDGRFWVSDAATSRVMRLEPDGRPDGTVIQFVPHNYTTAVDRNDPRRVFARFLEFEVDYSAPIQRSWRLVRNWRLDDLDPQMIGFLDGLHSVVTVQNDNGGPAGLIDQHTYAMTLAHAGQDPRRQIVELTPAGLVPTGITDLHPFAQLERDGTTILAEYDGASGRTTVWRNDYVAARTALGSIAATAGTPAPAVSYARPVAADDTRDGVGKIVCWDQFHNGGMHLGAFAAGEDAAAWLWRAVPEEPLDGGAEFDPNSQHGGGELAVLGRHAFMIYRGEFWNGDAALPQNPQGVGQANQIFHLDESGAVLGTMGVPGVYGGLDSQPASAGNMFSLDAVEVEGEIFLYTNNEVGRGVERWRLRFNDRSLR